MNTELKLTILAACATFLICGIAVGYVLFLLTHKAKLRKEEYLFNLRVKNQQDTIRIITEAATGPGIIGTEGTSPLRPPLLQLPIPPTGPAHRRPPSPSMLARRRQYPLDQEAPTPNHKTLIWDMLPAQPTTEG